MAETPKLGEHKERPSAMQESGPDTDEMSAPFAKQESAPENLDANKGEEVSRLSGEDREAVAEVAVDEGIDEFAKSVISGLEQAGLEIEDHEESLHPSETVEGSEPEDTEGFFEDWGTPGGAEPNATTKAREAEFPSHRTLSEIGLASAASFAAEYRGGATADSNKHDELADAVQSALLSIYGDLSGEAGPATLRDHGMSQAAIEPGWNGDAVHEGTGDPLSPQDVILNYFSYNPGQQGGAQPGTFNAGPGYAGEYGHAARRGATHSTQEYYSPQRHQQWAQYDGPPSFPVPAQGQMPPRVASARMERESSRLLGAAAIGLVGGIAIAVTLAVFVISSYGPDFRVSPGGYRTAEIGEQSYGRAAREEASPSEPAKTVSLTPATSQISDEIVASDATAIPGQPTALSIGVKSQRPLEQTLVSITGVPEGGRLNAGVDAGGGNWLLPPRRLTGLTVNLPAGSPSSIVLEAQLLDGNARTPLSAKRQFAIRMNGASGDAATPVASTQSMITSAEAAPQPSLGQAFFSFNAQTVSTPSTSDTAATRAPNEASFKTQTVSAQPSQATGAPQFQTALVPANPLSPQSQNTSLERGARKSAPQPEIEDLIREGNKRMREGDILEARQLYQKAILLGDPEAALAMGRSYDPIYFARIEKKNAEPDAAKAFDWYRKAMDGGAAQTAKVRIENLKHFLNE